MTSSKFKNIVFIALACICGVASGISLFSKEASTAVYAETTGMPNYFRAYNDSTTDGRAEITTDMSGNTFFFDEGEKLVLDISQQYGDGKAIVSSALASASDFDEGLHVSANDVTIADGITGFTPANVTPIDISTSSISLRINGERVSFGEGSLTLGSYRYLYGNGLIENASALEFDYATITIDLFAAEDAFAEGRYELTITNVIEFSGTDFTVSTPASYSVTFYVFKTTSYFNAVDANRPNMSMANVETASISPTSIYEDNYFFNYNASSSTLNLPTLTFPQDKFRVNIDYTDYQGVTYSTVIYYDGTDVADHEPFVLTRVVDSNIVITFNELGQYEFSYDFIYVLNGEIIELSGERIISQKPARLDVFGYQIFYTDINISPEEDNLVEFKSFNSDNTINSQADISGSNYANDTNYVNLNPNTTAPVSTNQAPVSFRYNANLSSGTDHSSTVYKWTGTAWDTGTTFSNGSITDKGTYLIKVTYTYSYYIRDNVYNTSQTFDQWFYFEITTTNQDSSITANGQTLNSGTYTRENVNVMLNPEGYSVFNSPVRLVVEERSGNSWTEVYSITSLDPVDADGVDFSCPEREYRNYRVRVYYGRDYSSTSAKYTQKTFNIDKQEISNLVFSKVRSIAGSTQYEKNGQISKFYTDQSVVFEWSEKQSGAMSWATYKYIALKSDSSLESLNTPSYFDSNNALSNGYALDYTTGSTLAETQYSNTASYSTFNDSVLLTEQGLHIFKVVDEAGNEAYAYIFIDKTSPIVKQRIEGEYQDIMPNNVISADVDIDFGRYKLISSGLTASQINGDTIDPWLQHMINEMYDAYSTDPTDDLAYFTGSDYLFFCPELSNTFFVYNGTSYTHTTINSGLYTYHIDYTYETSDGGTEANETSYTFFFVDESNDYFGTPSQYIDNYSLVHNVVISSDLSRATVLMNTDNISLDRLQAGYTTSTGYTLSNSSGNVVATPSDFDVRIKYSYAVSQTQVFSYVFLSDPADNVSVEKVVVWFYPFVTENGEYKLRDYATETVIFDRNNSIDLTTEASGDYAGYRQYNLNQTRINQVDMTTAGKYVITRTYTESSKDYITSNYDYFERKNVFIIDRQPIITAPQLIDGDYRSLVGGEIRIDMLSGQADFNPDTDSFYSIYSTSESLAVLTSNKLPLKLYVPLYKYGRVVSQNSTDTFTGYNELRYFFYRDSPNATQWKGDFEPKYTSSYNGGNNENIGKTISNYGSQNYLRSANFGGYQAVGDMTGLGQENTSFNLTVTVEMGSNSVSTSASNGFTTTPDLTSSGVYTVTIQQNSECALSEIAHQSVQFNFEIPDTAPQFSFLNSNGVSLIEDSSGTTYTNENEVSVTWQRPVDYMADIDPNKSYAYVLGNPSVRYALNDTNYFEDISSAGSNVVIYRFKDISAFPSGTSLVFHLEYEGLTEGIENRVAEKTLYIDRQAPTNLIYDLLELNSIDSNTFLDLSREYVDESGYPTSGEQKYNVTVQSGALAYYTPIVDRADIRALFGYDESGNRTSQDYRENYAYYVRAFASGTKFVEGYVQETSVADALQAQGNTHSLLSLDTLVSGNYYEIIERDAAGNMTIFTFLYIDREEVDSSVLMDYETKNPSDTTTTTSYSLHLSNFTQENSYTQNIYAIGDFTLTSFNLFNAEYFVVSVGGNIYLGSPYLGEREVYDISSWVDTSLTPTVITLDELLGLADVNLTESRYLVVRDTNKNLSINIYVTNQRLTYSQLSVGEGILVNSDPVITLESMTISAWNEALGYEVIYSASGSYASNDRVTVTSNQTGISFSVNSPSNISYRYQFTDNFGRRYMLSHTHGSTVITDNVQNEIATEYLNDKTYYLGNDTMSFLYNRVDYSATITIKYLTMAASGFGSLASAENYTNYNITTNIPTNQYFACQMSATDRTINIVTLKAPSTSTASAGFYGGAYYYEITLTSLTDRSDTTTYYILIDNLRAEINLEDDFGENKNELLTSPAIYSGNLTIRFSDKLSMIQNSALTDEEKELLSVLEPRVSLRFANGSYADIQSGHVVGEIGTYSLRLSQLYNETYYILHTYTFNISDASRDFYVVSVLNSETGNYEAAEETGLSFTYNDVTYYSHYIVNNDYYIERSQDQSVEIVSETPVPDPSGTSNTIIYTLSNRKASTTNANIISFHKTIVVTRIAQTNSIISNFTYVNADAQTINFDNVERTIAVTAENQSYDSLQIMWNSYYLVENNKIEVEITYNGEPYEPEITTVGTNSSIVLTRSGDYTFRFTDLAGNTHLFSHSSYSYQTSSYSLTYINGVVFELNGATPIMNAIYNEAVTLSIPSNTLGYYDSGSVPQLQVLRNGTAQTIRADDNGNYTISEPGYYEVWFTARYGGNDLRVQSYKFIIINPNESRWAFEYSPYLNYEIVTVTRNGNPLTISNPSSLLVSLYDERTGAGRYYVEIETNSGIPDERFSFEFWINEGEIPLTVSVAEGASTTDIITVTFNAYNLYNNIGDCVVTTGDETAVINADYINSSGGGVVTLNARTTGEHFIQVRTASGNLLYSYKVIKTEPLNTSSIIIIVVVVVVVVALTITIILLRKRMKIR